MIPTGVCGVPAAGAANLILGAIEDGFSKTPTSANERVGVVLLDRSTLGLFGQRLRA